MFVVRKDMIGLSYPTFGIKADIIFLSYSVFDATMDIIACMIIILIDPFYSTKIE